MNNRLDQVSHIVFDAYGTLLTPSQLRLKSHLQGLSQPEQAKIYETLRFSQTFDEVISAIPFQNEQKKADFIAQIRQDLEQIRPYEESTQVLSALREKYKLSIDSNLIVPYEEPILEHFHQAVDQIFLSFQLANKKGETQHYEQLLEDLNIAPEQLLFVGDNYEKDYLFPKKSGMNAIHLQRSGTTHQESITNLSELLTMLENKH